MSSRHYEWKVGEPLPALGEHSVAKHTIFDQYVEIYIERLTRTPSQTMLNLTIVGGFSGGGLYRHGTNEADGSPLRKLHWRLTNRFRHHGGAGFHALGFDPSQDLRQSLMTFMF